TDFSAGLLQNLFVGGVFPLHQLFEDAEKALAASRPARLEIIRRNFFGMLQLPFPRWIVDHLGKNYCSGDALWTPCPPLVKVAGMPSQKRVPLLFRCMGVYRFERKRDLN